MVLFLALARCSEAVVVIAKRAEAYKHLQNLIMPQLFVNSLGRLNTWE